MAPTLVSVNPQGNGFMLALEEHGPMPVQSWFPLVNSRLFSDICVYSLNVQRVTRRKIISFNM